MKFNDLKDKSRRFNERHPYFGLWMLLAVTFVIVIVISFVGGPDFGFYKMKEATFKDRLTARNVEDTAAMPLDTLAQAEPQKVEPDTTVKKIMVFGDSMTSQLASRLADYGAKNGWRVVSVTWDGSSTIGWSDSEKLTANLDSVKPDFIFISLGGNEIHVASKEARSKYVKRLLSHFEDIPFVWVGPPIKGKDEKFKEMVLEYIPNDAFFPLEFDFERGPDHIHPSRKGATVIVDSMMRWIPSSHHPILNEVPDSTTPKGQFRHIYYNARNVRVN